MPFDFNRQIIINNPLIWNEPRIITAVPNMGSNLRRNLTNGMCKKYQSRVLIKRIDDLLSKRNVFSR